MSRYELKSSSGAQFSLASAPYYNKIKHEQRLVSNRGYFCGRLGGTLLNVNTFFRVRDKSSSLVDPWYYILRVEQEIKLHGEVYIVD